MGKQVFETIISLVTFRTEYQERQMHITYKTAKKLYAATAILLSLFLQGCRENTGGVLSASDDIPPHPQSEKSDMAEDTGITSKPEAVPEAEASWPGTETLVSDTSPAAFPDTQAEKPDDTSSSISKALHVSGTKLLDNDGNTVQLKGVSTHGLAWFPAYINEDCFRQLKEDWGLNVIRLALYTAEYGGYCTGGDQESLKELVKNGVECAARSDLYVIIDWHILSDGNPNMYKDEAKSFFAEMAKQYAGYDNVLYEICNEPNGSASWSDIKSYAEEIIPVIRAYDEDAIILVGTPNWSQYIDQAAADPVSGYSNIMYTLHFYAAAHTDSLRNTMVSAIEDGLPVFVSEFGICDASGNGAIDEYQAKQWIDAMDKYDVSYVAWNLSNKEETSAILSSKCSKVSGFTEEDLSASGKWLRQMFKNGDSCMSP